jgi:RNA polymerase sigma-70 factor (ECF subfamily)
VDDLTQLALAGRDGDPIALRAFVRAAQPDVWRLARHLVGPTDADDVAQDALLRALRGLPTFEARSSVRTWLLAIARRAAADHLRATRRRRRRDERLQPQPDAPDHADAHALDALVGALGQDQRAAFVLTQMLGLTYAEAAAVCGCEIGTIRSRVARAREQLVEAYDAGGRSARRTAKKATATATTANATITAT